jgi:hypothetical protein
VSAQGSLFAAATKPKGPTGGTWSVSRTHRPGVVCELTYLEGALLRTLYVVTDAPQVGDGSADAQLLAAAPLLRAALEHAVEWLDEQGCDCGTDEPGTCALCEANAALVAAGPEVR